MRRRLLIATLAVGFAAGVAAAAAEAGEAQRLSGVWIAVSAERNGGPADDLKGHRLTVSGDRFSIRSKGKLLYRGTFQVDPSKKPSTIDFTLTKGETKGKTWLGIYLLDRDVLKICDNADDAAKGRPEAFATEPASGRVLLNFTRGGR